MRTKIHLRHMGLFNNAGMEFPACYVNAKPLDTDKGRLPTSGSFKEVTCKHCLNLIKRETSLPLDTEHKGWTFDNNGFC